jgi:phage host-nuclease inhibitor protein Gam
METTAYAGVTSTNGLRIVPFSWEGCAGVPTCDSTGYEAIMTFDSKEERDQFIRTRRIVVATD